MRFSFDEFVLDTTRRELRGPALGLIASGAGLGAVTLASALVALCAVPIALWLGTTRIHEAAR